MGVLRYFESELKRVLPVRRHTERDGIVTLRVDLSALRLNFQPLTTFVLIPAARKSPPVKEARIAKATSSFM